MKLRKLKLKNEDDVRFIYDVRRHRKVDKWLFGLRPANYDLHVEHIKRVQGTEKIYIICDGSIRVGFCSYKIGKDVEVGWKIHPDFHNKGYGTWATKALIKEIQKKSFYWDDIILYVTRNNSRAIHLYTKAGFKQIADDGERIKMKWATQTI